jgi:hypothetical protein
MAWHPRAIWSIRFLASSMPIGPMYALFGNQIRKGCQMNLIPLGQSSIGPPFVFGAM